MTALLALLALSFEQPQPTVQELFQRGLLLLRGNDARAARETLETVVRQMPEATLAWLALADARLRTGDLEGSLAAEQQAARLAPEDAAVREARAMFHARAAALRKTPQEAAPHWQQALALDPRRLDYRLRYAQFLLDHGAEKAAEATLLEAMESFPPHPESHRLLGLALYAQGKAEAALDAFLQAIALAPEEESLYASLETLLPPPASRMSAVRARLERYQASQPRQPLAPYLLALCSEPPLRETLLRKAIALDASFWPALFELHKTHQQRGEYAEARRLLEEVVRLHPSYAPAWYALGQICARAGDRDAARRARARHHELTAGGISQR